MSAELLQNQKLDFQNPTTSVVLLQGSMLFSTTNDHLPNPLASPCYDKSLQAETHFLSAIPVTQETTALSRCTSTFPSQPAVPHRTSSPVESSSTFAQFQLRERRPTHAFEYRRSRRRHSCPRMCPHLISTLAVPERAICYFCRVVRAFSRDWTVC